jgi:hypothetical protein
MHPEIGVPDGVPIMTGASVEDQHYWPGVPRGLPPSFQLLQDDAWEPMRLWEVQQRQTVVDSVGQNQNYRFRE